MSDQPGEDFSCGYGNSRDNDALKRKHSDSDSNSNRGMQGNSYQNRGNFVNNRGNQRGNFNNNRGNYNNNRGNYDNNPGNYNNNRGNYNNNRGNFNRGGGRGGNSNFKKFIKDDVEVDKDSIAQHFYHPAMVQDPWENIN